MLNKIKELSKDFAVGVLLTSVTLAVVYGVVEFITFLDFTKEQAGNTVLFFCSLVVVTCLGGLVRLNLEK